MKRIIFVFLFAVILVYGVAFSADSLEGVLRKNYESRGGLEKLKALKSMKISCKFFQPQSGMDMPAVMYQKDPSKMRMEMMVQDKMIVVAYDGQKAWMIIPFMSEEAQEMPQEDAKLFQEQAEFENPLITYAEKGYKLELVGEEKMEGTKVYHLKLTKKDGRVYDYFLDNESCIELKITTNIKRGDTDLLVESVMGDYKPVDGVQLPFYLETKAGGQLANRISIDAYELNTVIEDTLFAMPVKKTEAPAADKK